MYITWREVLWNFHRINLFIKDRWVIIGINYINLDLRAILLENEREYLSFLMRKRKETLLNTTVRAQQLRITFVCLNPKLGDRQ